MTKVENKEKDSPADFTIHDYLETQGPDLIRSRFDYYDFFRTNGASSCSMQHSRPTVKNQPQKKILRTLCTARPQFSASDLISVEGFGAGVSGSINGLRKPFHRNGFTSFLVLFPNVNIVLRYYPKFLLNC